MSLSRKMMRGSTWMFGMSWTLRLIGIVNTMILARLLTPEDFGLFAIATVFMGLLITFSEMGIELIVIREQNPDAHYYNTAWTISFIQKMMVAAIMFIGAPIVADYYGDPRALDIIRFMALIAVINAFRNLGVILFRKEHRFRKVFEFRVYSRISTFLFTVPVAYYLRNYWALIISMNFYALMQLFLSYRMHPFRPRFSLQGWRAFPSFAFYITGIRILQFLNRKFDLIALGQVSNSVQLGFYNMSAQAARMVTNDFIATVNQALFPGYSEVAHDPKKLAPTYLGSVGGVTTLLVPLGIGLSAVATDFVRLVLGPQWGETVPLMQWLALLAVGEGLLEVVGNQILIVIHKEVTNLKLAAFRLTTVVIGVSYAAYTWGVQGVAVAVAVISWAMVPVFFTVVSASLDIRYREMIKVVWRPFIASAMMYLAITMIPLQDWQVFLRFCSHILMGGAVYTLVLLGLWKISGSPRGTEQVVLELLQEKILKRRRKPDSDVNAEQ